MFCRSKIILLIFILAVSLALFNFVQAKTEVIIDKKIEPVKKTILLTVPFLAQAPFADWQDDRQQNACEEASVIMAMLWVKGEKTITKEVGLKKILVLAKFEQDKYKNYIDTNSQDTLDRLIKGYYKYNKAEVKTATIKAIINELEQGNLIIAPANGRKLKNKFFTAPGPLQHMLVIKGYDYKKKEFITNDPGTRWGVNFRYQEKVLFDALREYPTGHHLEIKDENIKTMIVVGK